MAKSTNTWLVKLEDHNRQFWFFVKAESDIDAIIEARREAKDITNTAHIVSVSKA